MSKFHPEIVRALTSSVKGANVIIAKQFDVTLPTADLMLDAWTHACPDSFMDLLIKKDHARKVTPHLLRTPEGAPKPKYDMEQMRDGSWHPVLPRPRKKQNLGPSMDVPRAAGPFRVRLDAILW